MALSMIVFINVSLAGLASSGRTLGAAICRSKRLAMIFQTAPSHCGADATALRTLSAIGPSNQAHARAITLTRHGFSTVTARTAAKMLAAAAMMKTRSQLPVTF